jgi:hypothetical protein
MRLNGSNAVMVETTALSMAYTWGDEKEFKWHKKLVPFLFHRKR